MVRPLGAAFPQDWRGYFDDARCVWRPGLLQAEWTAATPDAAWRLWIRPRDGRGGMAGVCRLLG
eukprot:11191244-Lingulodinium_polyedra.AAC.1